MLSSLSSCGKEIQTNPNVTNSAGFLLARNPVKEYYSVVEVDPEKNLNASQVQIKGIPLNKNFLLWCVFVCCSFGQFGLREDVCVVQRSSTGQSDRFRAEPRQR